MNKVKIINEKSQIVQFFLIVGFQSLGLFYSTILGAIIMTFVFVPVIIYVLLQGHISYAIGIALLYYPICFIWGFIAVKKRNKIPVNDLETKESAPELTKHEVVTEKRKVIDKSEPLDSPTLRFVGHVMFILFFVCGCYAIYDLMI